MKVSAQNISAQFQQGGQLIQPLKNINFEIRSGEKIALVGSSGSGKTTLFNIISGVLLPSSGRLLLDNMDWFQLSDDERTNFRAKNIGIIFQNYLLVPQLTALENIMLPVELNQKSNQKPDYQLGRSLLKKVGLLERADHLPSQLSGGECQRVAIARALILSPSLILADEPTGQLDHQTAKQVSQLMFELVSAQSATFILITHDLNLASQCDRILTLREGKIEE